MIDASMDMLGIAFFFSKFFLQKEMLEAWF